MGDAKKVSGGAVTAMHIHIVAGLLCAAVGAAVWLFAVSPVMKTASAAAAQKRAIAEQQKQADDLQNQVVLVEREIGLVLSEERKSPLRLEPVSKINSRLSDVSNLAEKHGLDVSVIQPGRVESLARFERVPIQLEGVGTFRKCATFLHSANRAFPDMGIAAVEVKNQPNNADGAADFAFTLLWYAAPSDSASTAQR